MQSTIVALLSVTSRSLHVPADGLTCHVSRLTGLLLTFSAVSIHPTENVAGVKLYMHWLHLIPPEDTTRPPSIPNQLSASAPIPPASDPEASMTPTFPFGHPSSGPVPDECNNDRQPASLSHPPIVSASCFDPRIRSAVSNLVGDLHRQEVAGSFDSCGSSIASPQHG